MAQPIPTLMLQSINVHLLKDLQMVAPARLEQLRVRQKMEGLPGGPVAWPSAEGLVRVPVGN